MAAPVLGGRLVSDEIIDLLLPVLFYRVRAWRWQRMHARVSSAHQIDEGDEGSAALAAAATV